MTSNQDLGLRLSSKELEQLIANGNLSLENLDLLQMDPSTIQHIQITGQQLQGMGTSGNPNLNRTAAKAPPAKPAPARQYSRPAPPQAYVEITEQPKARGLRFRYECEGRSAGSIPGETSTTERKTFPAIKIHNYSGPAVIVVSCVSKDDPYKPHPHNLVGKDCKKGVCTLRIRDTNVVSFPHLGIQCAKKKDVEGNLKQRRDINVDPFQTGFKHIGQNMDLNVVRLCFQVFLPDEQGKITRIVPPVVSQPIHDKKALNELIICRIDRTSGKPKGSDEVFLLCEKINRDDVRVRFYEEVDGKVIWEGFGDFGQNDVHRQFAIVFKTPPYKDTLISRPVDVMMQLQRPSDLEGSEPIQFTYMPDDPDPDRILEKRKRKAATLSYYNEPGGNISQETIKQRLKLKATRTTASRVKQEIPAEVIKQEAPAELPSYSFNNTGSQKSAAEFSIAMATTGNMVDPSGTLISSQASMSGGKVQYAGNAVPQQQAEVQGVNVTQQLAQLIAVGLTQPPLASQSNDSSVPTSSQSGQLTLQQAELIRQLLTGAVMNTGADQQQQQQQPANTTAQLDYDPNNPGVSQEMSSLGSMPIDPTVLQNYMVDSPMISFEGIEALSGNLSGNFDYDQQPVAAFENVTSADSPMNQQQIDETNAAITALNQK